ncbi:MAG: HPr(Ser) kinase/phosphatase [bacterium]
MLGENVLTVSKLYSADKKDQLKLQLIGGSKGLKRKITVSEINRPGLVLAGFFDFFRAERVQVFGKGEHSYINSLPKKKVREVFSMMLNYDALPCLFFTRNLRPHWEVIQICNKKNVPIFKTSLDTANFVSEVTVFLEENLAPFTTIHGVLVYIYGLGVLITGVSGIGKSECALELLKRGHMIVADDVVEIRHRSGGLLIGSGDEVIRHHMEVRGLGIIDIRNIFGVGTILDSYKIELVVHLEMWNPKKEYDRLGLEQKETEILGIKVPILNIPIYPGRNLAVLIEIAALNQRLRNKGLFTGRELNKKLLDIMKYSSISKSRNNNNKADVDV